MHEIRIEGIEKKYKGIMLKSKIIQYLILVFAIVLFIVLTLVFNWDSDEGLGVAMTCSGLITAVVSLFGAAVSRGFSEEYLDKPINQVVIQIIELRKLGFNFIGYKMLDFSYIVMLASNHNPITLDFEEVFSSRTETFKIKVLQNETRLLDYLLYEVLKGVKKEAKALQLKKEKETVLDIWYQM